MSLQNSVWNEKELPNLFTHQIKGLFLHLALVQTILTVNTFDSIRIEWVLCHCYDKV